MAGAPPLPGYYASQNLQQQQQTHEQQMQRHQQAVAAAQQKHAAASLRHAMATNPAMATAENAARLRQLEVSCRALCSRGRDQEERGLDVAFASRHRFKTRREKT